MIVCTTNSFVTTFAIGAVVGACAALVSVYFILKGR